MVVFHYYICLPERNQNALVLKDTPLAAVRERGQRLMTVVALAKSRAPKNPAVYHHLSYCRCSASFAQILGNSIGWPIELIFDRYRICTILDLKPFADDFPCSSSNCGLVGVAVISPDFYFNELKCSPHFGDFPLVTTHDVVVRLLWCTEIA